MLFVASAQAASIEAGRALVEDVCSACHGLTGVSVSEAIPHLAGQRATYIAAQLNALKDGTRKNAMMNAIAGQLTRAQIADIAAYFSSQQGAAAGARSEFMPHVSRTNVKFPDDHGTFVQYHWANFPEPKQLRLYYANRSALEAAKEGKPLPDGAILFSEVYAAKLDASQNPIVGANGAYERGPLVQYRIMARGPGWGREMPAILRNEDWNYAVFTAQRKLRQDVNHAECLACHKPQDKESFAFTLKQLAEAARKAN
jgi:cytochrome c553